MENIKKQIIYYTIVFVISFTLGLLFEHYVLSKNFNFEEENEEPEISLQKEQEEKKKDKILSKEEGCTMYVDISGALKNPGVYCLDNDSLVIDAVNKAGGFSKDAGMKFIARKINLAQPLVDSQKLYFPFEKELVCQLISLTEETEKIESMFNTPITTLTTTEPYTDVEQNASTTSSNSGSNTTDSANTQCVNINTATKEQLITLNGVGESTAEKIIQGRPYTNVEDLLNVSGIGEATLEKFKSEVCI